MSAPVNNRPSEHGIQNVLQALQIIPESTVPTSHFCQISWYALNQMLGMPFYSTEICSRCLVGRPQQDSG